MTHVDVSEKIDSSALLCGKRDVIGETMYYAPKDGLQAFDKLSELTCPVCRYAVEKVKAGEPVEGAVADAVSIAVSDCPHCGYVKLDGERRICCA